MQINELLKNPVKLVMEGVAETDIIRPDMPISKLVTIINDQSSGRVLDLLFVFINSHDKNFPIRAVVTHREFSNFLDKVATSLDTSGDTATLNKLELESTFPLRYFVSENDLIEKVYNIFKADVTDTVIVTNEQYEYIGKIKRNQFVDKLKELLVS